MKLNKQQFLDILTQLKPGIASRDIVEQNICYRFHPDKVVTFNDDVYISIPFESGLEGGVRAEELFQLVSKLPDAEIALETTSNEFRLSCEKTKAGITLIEAQHPDISVSSEWEVLSTELLDALKATQFSIGTNMMHMKHTCIHVQDKFVQSSDGFRASQVYLSEASPFNFLCPGFAVKHFGPYEFTHICVDNSWIHLTNQSIHTTFSLRKIDAEFFESDRIEKYLTVEGHVVEFPPQTLEILDRCLIMADQTVAIETSVEISFADGTLTCRSQKALGWVEEEVEIEFDGTPFKIRINPKHLSEILKRSPQVVVGKDRCLFTGENFKHVVVLIGD